MSSSAKKVFLKRLSVVRYVSNVCPPTLKITVGLAPRGLRGFLLLFVTAAASDSDVLDPSGDVTPPSRTQDSWHVHTGWQSGRSIPGLGDDSWPLGRVPAAVGVGVWVAVVGVGVGVVLVELVVVELLLSSLALAEAVSAPGTRRVSLR